MSFGPDAVRLDGKVALVTGAAQGIGAATALALARFGADVAICDRNAVGLAATAASVELLGRVAVCGELDVRDGDAVRAHVAEAVARFDHIDVLVNNVGGTFHADLLDTTDRGQMAIVHENFTTVTNCVRAVVPHMPDGGSIVTVTTIEAQHGSPGFAVYAAMKAAAESLTMSLALELADRAIRVNSLAPYGVTIEGGDPHVADINTSSRYLPAETPPLGREGTPDDCAAVIVFLAGPLSRFVTGASIPVDGGQRAAGGWRLRA